MPYLTPHDRWMVEEVLSEEDLDSLPSGPLNYFVTKLVDRWLGDTPNYERFNSAIGALECAKLELYRRVIAPYEDSKWELNGDVYRPRPPSPPGP